MLHRSWLLQLRILHADQIQPTCGSGRAGDRTVLSFQNCNDILRLQRSLSDQQESPYQIANHVMEESVPADFIDKFFSPALPLRRKNCSDVASCTKACPERSR